MGGVSGSLGYFILNKCLFKLRIHLSYLTVQHHFSLIDSVLCLGLRDVVIVYENRWCEKTENSGLPSLGVTSSGFRSYTYHTNSFFSVNMLNGTC